MGTLKKTVGKKFIIPTVLFYPPSTGQFTWQDSSQAHTRCPVKGFPEQVSGLTQG